MAHAILTANVSNRQGAHQQTLESIFADIEERKTQHNNAQRNLHPISSTVILNNRPITTEDVEVNPLSSVILNSARSNISSANDSSTQIQAQHQTNGTVANLDEIFSCFICFGPIQNAVMCPSCSKLGCGQCLRKWLQETRQQCPHCRASLRVSQLINFRFFDDITSAIQTLQQNGASNQFNRRKEVCQEHKTQLSYYCNTCSKPICSDCAMFGDQHKQHQFEHLKVVYQRHVELIRTEANGLRKRLRELNGNVNEVQSTIEKVQKAKDERCKELDSFVESIQAKLSSQLKTKLLTLMGQKTAMTGEIEQLEAFQRVLNQELFQQPKSKLIKKSADLVRQLKEIHQEPTSRFVQNSVQIDFNSDIVPDYDCGDYKLRHFSQLRHSEDPIYSPQLISNGITWRLKVYPNGNGQNAQGNYISVFLEMFKGPSHMQPSEPQKYEYRVEMISHRRPSQKVVREYQSEFEVGECWGYNRFYRIDQLEAEGYLSIDSEDCIYLKFYVRPPTFAQLARDQKKYIEELEKKAKTQEEEISQFRKKCNDQIRKQKKKTSSSKKSKLESRQKETEEETKTPRETSTFDIQADEIVPDKQKVKKLRVVTKKITETVNNSSSMILQRKVSPKNQNQQNDKSMEKFQSIENQKIQSLNQKTDKLTNQQDYEQVSKKYTKTASQKLQQAITIQKQMQKINSQSRTAEQSISSSETDENQEIQQFPYEKKCDQNKFDKNKKIEDTNFLSVTGRKSPTRRQQTVKINADSMISVSEDSQDSQSNTEKFDPNGQILDMTNSDQDEQEEDLFQEESKIIKDKNQKKKYTNGSGSSYNDDPNFLISEDMAIFKREKTVESKRLINHAEMKLANKNFFEKDSKIACNDQGVNQDKNQFVAKKKQSAFQIVEKEKKDQNNMFNDESDEVDALNEVGEGSDEIDEGFLQVAAYTSKKNDDGPNSRQLKNMMKKQTFLDASQDYMQMPHEGDESDSSSDMSEEVDHRSRGRDRAPSYSDLDSNEFENVHKESSAYSNEDSFDHDEPENNNLENVSCGDEDGDPAKDQKKKPQLKNSESSQHRRK